MKRLDFLKTTTLASASLILPSSLLANSSKVILAKEAGFWGWLVKAVLSEVAVECVIKPLVGSIFDGWGSSGSTHHSAYRRTKRVLDQRERSTNWMEDSGSPHSLVFEYDDPTARRLRKIQEEDSSRIIGASFLSTSNSSSRPDKNTDSIFFLKKIDSIEPLAFVDESHQLALLHLIRYINGAPRQEIADKFTDKKGWFLLGTNLMPSTSNDGLYSHGKYRTANGILKFSITTKRDPDGYIHSFQGHVDVCDKGGKSLYKHRIDRDYVERLRSLYA
jgi:hypothetical protein